MSNEPTPATTPRYSAFDDVQDWLRREREATILKCAEELTWMAHGHVAHEAFVLLSAAKRLRDEREKIALRVAGVKA